MKRFILTRHAEQKLSERGIPLAWVEKVARSPLWTEPESRDPTAERRFGAIGEPGPRFLRVVCVETETAIRVITAMFDRGARPKQ